MKALLILSILFTHGLLLCQVDLVDTFRRLYHDEKYDVIINYEKSDYEILSAKAIYYRAMSHYMKSEDALALELFDLAIELGPVDHDMFYYKGMTHYYLDENDPALTFIDKAISLLPDEPAFYASKGDVYYKLEEIDSARVYFEKATVLPSHDTRVLLSLGEIYQYQNQIEKALGAYQAAMDELSIADDLHQNCSYNLSLMQYLVGDFEKAKFGLQQHVKLYADDYHAVAKLIQAHYALAEYDESQQYRDLLYDAYESNVLPDQMKDMFCFDQFMWDDRLIMVFENFDESEESLIEKHQFFILDEDGKTDYKIASESSFATRLDKANKKYVLGLTKDGVHSTFWDYRFNDDLNYPELKEAVLDILNQKVKPRSKFVPLSDKNQHIDLNAVFKTLYDSYAPLSDESKHELISNLKIKTCAKGEVIVREGQNADKVFYVVQGCARAYYLKDGRDITDWFAFEDEFITAIISFFGDEPSPHYIELLEDAILIELTKEVVERLSQKFHDFEHLIRIAVTRTMLQHQKRLSSILFNTAEERYEQIMLMYPNITNRVPLTHIASYLGMTLETLSRVRGARSRI